MSSRNDMSLPPIPWGLRIVLAVGGGLLLAWLIVNGGNP